MEAAAHSIERAVIALVSAGPIGVVVAAVLIAAVIAFIIFARSRQLFDNSAAEARIAGFQQDILTELKDVRKREREQALTLETLRAEVFLCREQLRRLIDQIGFFKRGQISIEEIELPVIK